MNGMRVSIRERMAETTEGSEHADTSTLHFLVLETQGELYAIRWALVSEAGVICPSEIDSASTPPEVERNGVVFPLRYVWELVGLEEPRRQVGEMAAVFLEEGEKRMLLVPDRILWKQESRLRELPEWLAKAPLVAGVIALESGVPVIVIEPFTAPAESGERE